MHNGVDIVEVGKATRFGAGQDPLATASAGGKKAWSIKRHLRRLAAQEVDAEDDKAFTLKGKVTRAERLAMKALKKADEGDMQAFSMVTDRLDGKVAQPLSGDPDNPLVMLHGPITESDRAAKLAALHDAIRARLDGQVINVTPEVGTLPGTADASAGEPS